MNRKAIYDAALELSSSDDILSQQELSTLTTGTFPLNMTFSVTDTNGEAIYDTALELSSSYDMLYVPKVLKGGDSSKHVYGIESGKDIEFSSSFQGGGQLNKNKGKDFIKVKIIDFL